MKSKKAKTLQNLAFVSMGICLICFLAFILKETGVVEFTTPNNMHMAEPAFTFGLIAFGLLTWSQNSR